MSGIHKIRHEWYQNDEAVTFTLFVKNAPKDAVIDIQSESISISYPLASGSDFGFEIGPLAHEVDPAQSKSLILSTKIELKLRKAVSGIKWTAFEKSDAEAAIAASATATSYPTSSKSGTKNWDSLAQQELGDSKDNEYGDDASGFFKSIYENADDDTRKAMMKSYVESNGTALSTNWSEVKKETVKTEPPKGMEAKKWNS
ncbi:SGS domain-containing protein [Lipomyces japonicus]|uniref:SGS domain-containing protein n=1 Tax=Lipomyces japonicus TaxID=56871 RepID=UPI0034CD41EE